MSLQTTHWYPIRDKSIIIKLSPKFTPSATSLF